MYRLERLTCKMFTGDVILTVLYELESLREELGSYDRLLARQAIQMSFTPYFQRIGKAASLFALRHMNNIRLVVEQIELPSETDPENLDNFIEIFSSNYFQRTDNLPKTWFPVVVLTFCGIIGAIAVCCNALKRQQFVVVCCDRLELEMLKRLEDLHDVGGWLSLYDAAEQFEQEYDSHYLTKKIGVAEDLRD